MWSLGVSRSSLYLKPSVAADPRLPLASVIDRIYLEPSCMWSRQMPRALLAHGLGLAAHAAVDLPHMR